MMQCVSAPAIGVRVAPRGSGGGVTHARTCTDACADTALVLTLKLRVQSGTPVTGECIGEQGLACYSVKAARQLN
eukprot:1566968-Rhodomonas_salina.1